MRRNISNVEIEQAEESEDVFVRSNVIIGELRRGRQTMYFAQQKHRLRWTEAGLRMAAKTILFVNNNEPMHNLSFIV